MSSTLIATQLRRCFALDDDEIISYVMGLIIHFKVKSEVRRKKKIGNSCIYYETNLSAHTVLAFIKALIEKYVMVTDEFEFVCKYGKAPKASEPLVLFCSYAITIS